jgi:cyclic-di-GMP phosphodiesterase, flagellum assembly factor TipF
MRNSRGSQGRLEFMQRILLAIGGAAILCAVATLLLQLAIAQGLPVDEVVLLTAIATLILAALATFLSYRAITRSNDVSLELERLSRSMDAAIKDVSARGDRDAAVLGNLSATVSRKLEALSGKRTDTSHDDGPGKAEATGKRSKSARKPDQSGSDHLDQPGVEAALRRVASTDEADLALQPIIAAGRGAAGGFEVHFHIQPEEGEPVDIRRLSREVDRLSSAALERLAVVSATEAARKRPGDINDKMPLHVAISSALLDDGLEFAAVLDIFRLHPALAHSIVLSLPAELVEADDHRAPLEILSGLDIGLAAEDWTGTADGLETIKKSNCAFIKLSADRLLDRGTRRSGSPAGADLIAMIADAEIEIIATDVASDEDAVSLIDIGIDLMTGEQLSPPRRIKDDGRGPLSA